MGVYRALRQTFAVAEGDRFGVVEEAPPGALVFDRSYRSMDRSGNVVIIEITCNNTRTVDQKRSLYAAIAENLGIDPGIRPDDVLVCLVEVAKENWSMGRAR